MKSDRVIQLVAALTLVASLLGSTYLTSALAASVGRHGLVFTERAEEGDPPEVGLGIAMGAFRGMFVNVLWWRANKAKESGNFYEAIDLARTITRLQPRFPRVWVFHAWNMAYNISVATQTREERWQWVNAGVRLLRDEGVPANPTDLLIQRELAWIFLHKVQGVMDDAHPYYKRRFAEEWTVVLGPPRRSKPGLTREERVKECVEFLQRISDSPDTLDGVIRKEPLAEGLIKRLQAEAGLDLTKAESRLELLRAIEYSRSLGFLVQNLPKIGVRFADSPMTRMLQDPSLAPAFAVLVPHVRKRVLIDAYHMEPDRMARYVQRYGPLDWRAPAAHALYWSTRGVDEAMTRVTERNKGDFDFLNTDRITIHAVQELARYGTIVFDILRPESYLSVPDPDFIPTYRGILTELNEREADQMRAKYGEKTRVEERAYRLYNAGYENFMRDAISMLYRRGDAARAQEYKDILYADFVAGRLNWNDEVEQRYQLELPLDEFVLRQIYNRVTTPNIAVAELTGSLQAAYVNGLLQGDTEQFRRNMAYARLFHSIYVKEQVKDTGMTSEGRLEVLPRDFARAATNIFLAVMLQLGVTQGQLEDSAIMYGRAPIDLQLAAYDELSETIKAKVDAQAKEQHTPPFDQWFPPPEGYAEYRAAREAREGKGAKKATVELK